MKNILKLSTLIILVLFLDGCSTKITKMGTGNVYMAYSTGAGFNPSLEAEKVTEAANELAKKENMVMIPIDLKLQQGIMGSTPPSATLHFKLVSPDSPEVKNKDNDTVGINKLELSNKSDKGNSLEKKLNEIKELLNKNMITQDEYDKMRMNLINNPS